MTRNFESICMKSFKKISLQKQAYLRMDYDLCQLKSLISVLSVSSESKYSVLSFNFSKATADTESS